MLCFILKVTVLRTFDLMLATAQRQPEGAFFYLMDTNDLYVRVRDGVKKVLVWSTKYTHPYTTNKAAFLSVLI